MTELEFWRKRKVDQLQHIRELADRKFTWTGRMQQLLTSALEVLEIIGQEIEKHGAPLYKIVDKDGDELPMHYARRYRSYGEAKKLVDRLNVNGEYRPYTMKIIN